MWGGDDDILPRILSRYKGKNKSQALEQDVGVKKKTIRVDWRNGDVIPLGNVRWESLTHKAHQGRYLERVTDVGRNSLGLA